MRNGFLRPGRKTLTDLVKEERLTHRDLYTMKELNTSVPYPLVLLLVANRPDMLQCNPRRLKQHNKLTIMFLFLPYILSRMAI